MLARYEPPGASRESAGAPVVVFLLLVIIAIMLLGASAFLGLVGFVIGGIVAIIIIANAAEHLKDINGTQAIETIALLAACAIALIVTVRWKRRVDADAADRKAAQAAAERRDTRASKAVARRTPGEMARQGELESVWATFKPEITARFGEEARATARWLYDAGDVVELGQFCRHEIARLDEQASQLQAGGSPLAARP